MKPPSTRKPVAAAAGTRFAFATVVERIAAGMDYYAVSVPAKVTRALRTRAAVPVQAEVNGSDPFACSLYPVGDGRHYLRIRNQVCKAVGIGAGDRVRVQVTVRDRCAEIGVPADLGRALRAAKVAAGFADLPIGKKAFLLRRLGAAVRPATRAQRILEVVDAARRRQQPKA